MDPNPGSEGGLRHALGSLQIGGGNDPFQSLHLKETSGFRAASDVYATRKTLPRHGKNRPRTVSGSCVDPMRRPTNLAQTHGTGERYNANYVVKFGFIGSFTTPSQE